MSNAAAPPKENICIGLLAHVDAGKTTLSEAMLYLSGRLRKLGRVDHRDSFLDTNSIERERGITIFSKQAIVELPRRTVTLMEGEGLVSGKKIVLYCVLTRFEIHELREIIDKADSSAFIAISDVSEIIGTHMKKTIALEKDD